MPMRTLSKESVKGKKILLRIDFNVGTQNGRITDDSRILAHLPTIRQILDWQAQQVILLAHLAPKTGLEPLWLVAKHLSQALGEPKPTICEDPIPPSYQLTPRLVLLENVRFEEGETPHPDIRGYSPYFAAVLACMVDVFVLDALSVAHRRHASVYGVAEHLPAFAGPLLAKEVEILSGVLRNPTRPLVVIIGGDKVQDKEPVIQNLLPLANTILCGGKVAHDLLATGKYDDEPKVILPVDGSPEDIGPETVKRFQRVIGQAETIVWAGPMGKFEEVEFAQGTREIAQAVAKSPAYKIVAGGNTQEALASFGLISSIDFISQGGGATLEFLAGNKLPGLEALGYYQDSDQTWTPPQGSELKEYLRAQRESQKDYEDDPERWRAYMRGRVWVYTPGGLYFLGSESADGKRTLQEYGSKKVHHGRAINPDLWGLYFKSDDGKTIYQSMIAVEDKNFKSARAVRP